MGKRAKTLAFEDGMKEATDGKRLPSELVRGADPLSNSEPRRSPPEPELAPIVENGIPFSRKGGKLRVYLGPLATVGDLDDMETKIEKLCIGNQTKVADSGLLGEWIARRFFNRDAECKDLFDWS